jgi:hypothetical protein
MQRQSRCLITILLFASPMLFPTLFFPSYVMAADPQVTVSIGDITVFEGGTIKVPVVIQNVTALGAGAIEISYNSTVVHVIDVTEGGGNALLIGASGSNNSANPGYVRIASFSTRITGRTGDVIFADVTFQAVGPGNSTSALNISVISLIDVGYMDIPHTIKNGSFHILEVDLTKLDTGNGAYPSISGIHRGAIIPNRDIPVNKLFIYPCQGTGGHIEYVRIGNTTWNTSATWSGYSRGDWYTLSFNPPFVLLQNETYSYEIVTGSYPQILHQQELRTLDGSFINCTSFVDLNGNVYDDWIPAIRLFNDVEGGS